MLPRLAPAVLPALSWQVPFAVWPSASAVFVSETVAASTPDSESAQSQTTVTSVLFQPFALAGVRLFSAIVGAPVSMLIPDTEAPAVLPARSVHVPDAV